ncbi:PREDICTED: melanoma antigen preferentially expressed in tumors-like [Elephantulus edwardii]|uniref:melanoma antigen preferentially expressed in tumors-like n=1 Tax=Elephantulus edwardii TaxID=28737 RepID=UPI0003F097EC|nr:PREDICTED: melanoma antigen preferentially expressed in tumors-like [Elephantulus edwardii]
MFQPHSLFDLAKESLVKNESAVTGPLLPIPCTVWEDLFTEAMQSNSQVIVAAMVAACPLSWLDLDSMMEQASSSLSMLSSVFKGLGIMLDQRPPCATGQLTVLLPPAPETWVHEELDPEHRCYFENRPAEMQSPRKPRRERRSRSAPRQPVGELELVGDLSFKMMQSNELLTFLRCRVQEGKVLPLLCCQKVTFSDDLPEFPVIEKILGSVRLDRVEELRIHHTEDRRLLSMLAPYLPRLVHLRTLLLQSLVVKQGSSRQRRLLARWNTDEELDGIFTELTSQLTHLRQLQHLRLSNVYLCGNVGQFLRHLETPLESLTISSIPCSLEISDLQALSSYPCTSKLKVLNLSHNNLANINVGLLRTVIYKISATLDLLDLSHCGLLNSHLVAILSALSQCEQLRLFRFCGNCVDVSTMKRLLRRTIPTDKSRLMVLPLPDDAEDDDDDVYDYEIESRFINGLSLLLQELGVHSQIYVIRDEEFLEEHIKVLMLRT